MGGEAVPLPLKSFYLIRHGRSQANADGLAAGGGLDTPLTDEGRAQAAATATLVGDLDPRPGAVVHSPLSRARDTAAALSAPLGLEMHADPELREHMMGAWEGRPWAEYRPDWQAGVTPPGGETQAALAARVQAAVRDALARFEVPMLVAHGGTFRAVGALYGVEICCIPNARLHLFEPAAGPFPWRVWAYGPEGRAERDFTGAA